MQDMTKGPVKEVRKDGRGCNRTMKFAEKASSAGVTINVSSSFKISKAPLVFVAW